MINTEFNIRAWFYKQMIFQLIIFIKIQKNHVIIVMEYNVWYSFFAWNFDPCPPVCYFWVIYNKIVIIIRTPSLTSELDFIFWLIILIMIKKEVTVIMSYTVYNISYSVWCVILFVTYLSFILLLLLSTIKLSWYEGHQAYYKSLILWKSIF